MNEAFLFAIMHMTGSTPYSDWAATNAPNGTPTDDYDGDGVSNALEFVLGGSAATNDLSKLPTTSTSGGNMTFTFHRDQTSIDGSTTVTIEVGTDLATWPDVHAVPDVATAGPPVTVVKDTSPGFDTVTLTLPMTARGSKFARLKLVVAP